MNLVLTRTTLTDTSTIGELTVDGTPECVTLELPVKDGLPGSAIPEGEYPVVLAPSPKFEAVNDVWVQNYASVMPHVIQIPDRTLIMIHWGNIADDTNGCILVGTSAQENIILHSRVAFGILYTKIQAGIRAGGCSLKVTSKASNA